MEEEEEDEKGEEEEEEGWLLSNVELARGKNPNSREPRGKGRAAYVRWSR